MRTNLFLQTACALALCSACDTRADQKYSGDSLLHLEGRVVLKEDEANELVPVLAFGTYGGGFEVVEVDATGSFPNNFELEVYSPPPAVARVEGQEKSLLPPGVQVALAYLGALPKRHESRFLSAHYVETGPPVSSLAACAGATPACQRVERWCVDAQQEECRVVGLPCDRESECRPVASEGNSAIINRPSDAFYGLSQNVVVMWTRDGLPASSLWSRALGLKRDLKPGYNLIKLGQLRPSEDSDGDVICTYCASDPEPVRDPDPIEAEALARYNAAHGTDYASKDEAYDALFPPDSHDASAYDDFIDEVSHHELLIKVEQGIDISEFDGTELIEDWRTPLVITVGFGISQPL